MKGYWLIRNSIDFCWIAPFVEHLLSKGVLTTIVIDVSEDPSIQTDVREYFNTSRVNIVSEKLPSGFFEDYLVDLALFEWGVGRPFGVHSLIRWCSRLRNGRSYRESIIAMLKSANAVTVALPHGYNVKLDAVSKVGLKAQLVSPFKLARDRNFFDIYGFDTLLHATRFEAEGIDRSRLLKVPPLFAYKCSNSFAENGVERVLFIVPKLQNKIDLKALSDYLRGMLAESEIDLALHPRQSNMQRDWLISEGLYDAFHYVELGNNPAAELTKYSKVVDVGSSIGLMCAYCKVPYTVLTALSSNRTIFELVGVLTGGPLGKLECSIEALSILVNFFHYEDMVENELVTFERRVSKLMKQRALSD